MTLSDGRCSINKCTDLQLGQQLGDVLALLLRLDDALLLRLLADHGLHLVVALLGSLHSPTLIISNTQL